MKTSTVQALSFISGLTIAAIAVGVTVGKNQTLRNEIEGQLKNILSITKPILLTVKGLVSANSNQNQQNQQGQTDDQVTTTLSSKAADALNSQWRAAREALNSN